MVSREEVATVPAPAFAVFLPFEVEAFTACCILIEPAGRNFGATDLECCC